MEICFIVYKTIYSKCLMFFLWAPEGTDRGLMWSIRVFMGVWNRFQIPASGPSRISWVHNLWQVGKVVNLRMHFHIKDYLHSQHTCCPGNISGASWEPWYPVGCFHCTCTFISQLLCRVPGEKPEHGQNWAHTWETWCMSLAEKRKTVLWGWAEKAVQWSCPLQDGLQQRLVNLLN